MGALNRGLGRYNRDVQELLLSHVVRTGHGEVSIRGEGRGDTLADSESGDVPVE